MEKEKLESLLIDYLDGLLNQSERESVEKLVSENEEARVLFEQLRQVMSALDHTAALTPSQNMKANFLKNLKQAERESKPKGTQIFFSPMVMRVAAAVALVMSGVAIGYWINRNNQQEQEMLALRKQMDEVKQMMMAQLGNDQSASQRMIGVSVAQNMPSADDEIVSALSKALTEDPNTNVRMAALEALGKFNRQPHVRKVLIASLAKQTDPVIQIALIRLMVEMKEKESIKELERMTTDENLLPAVKDEAHAGIMKLS
jgi:Predicted transmembrane transcriptional regulator (anti-sigma factor)